jgi:hypothetical protein
LKSIKIVKLRPVICLVQPWPTRGPSTNSEKRYFGAKSIRSLEKTQILALKMAIFQKCGPQVDLGWPWLV